MDTSEMRLTLALRPKGLIFDDNEIASIRNAFKEFAAGLPYDQLEMSISYPHSLCYIESTAKGLSTQRAARKSGLSVSNHQEKVHDCG